jgi:hypothetical protein
MLNQTDLLVHYFQKLFQEKLNATAEPSELVPPISFSVPLLYECERVTSMLVEAFQHKCNFIQFFRPQF